MLLKLADRFPAQFASLVAIFAIGLSSCGDPANTGIAGGGSSYLSRSLSTYSPTLVVANTSGPSSINGYTSSGGNAAVFSIHGSKTQLFPRAVAVDPTNGQMYVANSYLTNPPIVIFGHDANGNVAPKYTLASYAITNEYLSVGLDASENIWVGQGWSGSDPGNILEFAAGAHGPTVSPINIIQGGKTTIFSVHSVVSDPSSNIYVLNQPETAQFEIAEFSAGSKGNVAPVRVIAGSNTGMVEPFAIAVDTNDYVYVTDVKKNSVKVFGPDQSGNVAPHLVIQGSNTGLQSPEGIAVDAEGNIYVGSYGYNSSTPEILEFASGAKGNATPIRIITSGITTPWGLAICPSATACDSGGASSNHRR